jgi:hypothetical protein
MRKTRAILEWPTPPDPIDQIPNLLHLCSVFGNKPFIADRPIWNGNFLSLWSTVG